MEVSVHKNANGIFCVNLPLFLTSCKSCQKLGPAKFVRILFKTFNSITIMKKIKGLVYPNFVIFYVCLRFRFLANILTHVVWGGQVKKTCDKYEYILWLLGVVDEKRGSSRNFLWQKKNW